MSNFCGANFLVRVLKTIDFQTLLCQCSLLLSHIFKHIIRRRKRKGSPNLRCRCSLHFRKENHKFETLRCRRSWPLFGRKSVSQIRGARILGRLPEENRGFPKLAVPVFLVLCLKKHRLLDLAISVSLAISSKERTGFQTLRCRCFWPLIQKKNIGFQILRCRCSWPPLERNNVCSRFCGAGVPVFALFFFFFSDNNVFFLHLAVLVLLADCLKV